MKKFAHKAKWLLLLVMLPGFSACLKIGEYYAGLNMQPETPEFEPALNVYGLLMAGDLPDSINHHFEVQQVLDLLEWTEDIEVSDATVLLQSSNQKHEVKRYELVHQDSGRYFNAAIDVNPGERWTYECTKDSFSITSDCIVPAIPVLAQNPVISANSLRLSVKADSSAFLYQFYLLTPTATFELFLLPENGSNTAVMLEPGWDFIPDDAVLFICAYDQQLRQYMAASNTFFKPNAYRPPFSTVEGGYGTFGAVSMARFVLNEI
ncbi:DUF4249 domain-containing protein [Roseimarinus sediminis]|uniref:hypothetical protein n=1 Tax=Roseimarinus sediminis TaxID=1610899 RepID=UPI003D23DBC3